MRLLNPIFDSVFKYLMEDIEIAKGLISAIIEQDVTELIPAPQEQTSTLLSLKSKIELQRLDYVAIISGTNQEGKAVTEKVLIEVQKSPVKPEIGRFRKYIAEKYKHVSIIPQKNGIVEEQYLPIKTIYIIDETFNDKLPGVLKRKGQYIDVLKHKEYQGDRDEFVELLTHEAYFIQVRLVPPDVQSTITHLLSMFTPWYRQKDERFIEYPITEDELELIKDKILKRMIRKLHGIVENDKMKMQMELELEYEDYFDKMEKAAQKRINEAQKKAEEAQQRENEERKQKETAIVNLHANTKMPISQIAIIFQKSEAEIIHILTNNGIQLE